MSRPRVVLADDHTMLVEAFEKLLSPSCEIVGKVADGMALVNAVRDLRPDVVVLDISMPMMNGLTAASRIREFDKDVKLVFLTMNEDPDLAAQAFQVGASAYLLKRSAASELLAAIQQVVLRRSYVTPLVTEGMVQSLMEGGAAKQGRQEITRRQREVVQLLAEGRSMKEVATVLNIAPRTVAFHKYRLMEQLHVKTNAELIQYAVKHHIV
jgi:DNA-binding NarL/FixJ family response regulator